MTCWYWRGRVREELIDSADNGVDDEHTSTEHEECRAKHEPYVFGDHSRRDQFADEDVDKGVDREDGRLPDVLHERGGLRRLRVPLAGMTDDEARRHRGENAADTEEL